MKTLKRGYKNLINKQFQQRLNNIDQNVKLLT